MSYHPFLPGILSPETLGAYIDAPKDPQRAPGFSKVVQQVRFTQWFILTYHAFVVVIICLLTVLHWGRRLQKALRYRTTSSRNAPVIHDSGKTNNAKSDILIHEHDREGSSSSGSSTFGVEQNDTQHNVHTTEQSPLLGNYSSSSTTSSFMSRTRAMLMYQPAPIPVVNKSLPPNGTSLFIVAFLAVNMFYLLYGLLNLDGPFAIADRAAMVFVANLPLLYLLAAKNQPLKLLTGYSYESLNIFHRRLGEWLCLVALVHAVGMIAVWWVFLRPIGWSLLFYLTRKVILTGVFAFLSFEVLYWTSLASFRRRCYELFLVLHVVLQAAALILLWFHHHHARLYVGLALAIFLIDRIVFRTIFKSSFETATLSVMDSGTIKLSAPVRMSPSSWLRLPLIRGHGWRPTDHIFLTVPSLSRKHWVQAHPFTIASAAPGSNDCEAKLDLIIRARDGFSRDLLRHAMVHNTVAVRLDGPYGSQHALETVLNSKFVLLVAGGSGIAVVNPLLHALLSQPQATEDEEAHIGPSSKKRIGLVWIVREEAHKAWLGEGQLELLNRRGVDIIVPKATAEGGRPDMHQMVQAWVQDKTSPVGDAAGVVCCGPDEMSWTVRNACAELVSRGYAVNVQVEKFGW